MMNVTALHHNHRVKINNYTQLSDYSISVPLLTPAYLTPGWLAEISSRVATVLGSHC